MDALALWGLLRDEHPERIARIANKFEPITGSAQALVEKLMDLRSQVAIGNDKCGTVGNPYEQPAEDLSVLFVEAERISGFKGRFRWERT